MCNLIILDNFQNIYLGPNSDLLYEPRYRLKDRCHFSSLGQEMLSSEWANSLQRIYNDLLSYDGFHLTQEGVKFIAEKINLKDYLLMKDNKN